LPNSLFPCILVARQDYFAGSLEQISFAVVETLGILFISLHLGKLVDIVKFIQNQFQTRWVLPVNGACTHADRRHSLRDQNRVGILKGVEECPVQLFLALAFRKLRLVEVDFDEIPDVVLGGRGPTTKGTGILALQLGLSLVFVGELAGARIHLAVLFWRTLAPGPVASVHVNPVFKL